MQQFLMLVQLLMTEISIVVISVAKRARTHAFNALRDMHVISAKIGKQNVVFPMEDLEGNESLSLFSPEVVEVMLTLFSVSFCSFFFSYFFFLA